MIKIHCRTCIPSRSLSFSRKATDMISLPSEAKIMDRFKLNIVSTSLMMNPHLKEKNLMPLIAKEFADRELPRMLIKFNLDLMLMDLNRELKLPDYVIRLISHHVADELEKDN